MPLPVVYPLITLCPWVLDVGFHSALSLVFRGLVRIVSATEACSRLAGWLGSKGKASWSPAPPAHKHEREGISAR